ncbi:MAG: helix-turn-helix transcriptional regulator [Clostridiales Family XIII bacterium]|jgi:DNA-binding Xre family transcriptional regulator|nr:helix-turn-helix transcriptional regulator [Clostridiales Family XIII bacterium]
MGIIYNKLWKLLIDRRMKKGDLQREAGISSASMAKLSKGKNVNTEILVKICNALAVEPGDIMELDTQTYNEQGESI